MGKNITSTGYHSTGNGSTGHYSTGDGSTGNGSTGHYSTGDYSTGSYSAGNFSTGDHSTGDYSVGNWSISDYSTGHFSTQTPELTVFDEPCELEVWEEWIDNEAPLWLFFELTEWVYEQDMADKEKQDYPKYKTTGGYLRVYDHQEAFQRSYNNATREEQLKILTCPNFNADKFYEISGIRVEEE